MATAFDDNEKELIRKELKKAAVECLVKYGVKKTTVDEIVQMVGISKGSFYNFYPAKEVLFFMVLEEYQKSIISKLINRLKELDNIGVDEFTDLIYGVYQEVRKSFIMNIIRNQEFEYFIKKLPKELIINHHSLDDTFTRELFSYIKIRDDINIDIVAASLRAIFMSMIYVEEIGEYVEEIGEKEFDEVLMILIRGVAKQLIEEDYNNE
ncbi:TetR/AcrR family transcriptional regulator [Senegalia massiliensis]|uniref:TetR/AcrR family transcriptional regulator n=1 Tax=Senegalia massiliensis TaxID=1720316 RepID=A0A845QTU8_9CLOT|nr:TetR/AcrR family transcriptional regulator [Senegalia massiliensis]NBI05239.1 TetR/AcrR family transcriptional regulator [Senegalia massiliensis]